MIIYIKNLTNDQVKIQSLKLGLQHGEIRKLIADFDKEFIDVKNELDILVDDLKIEIVNELGQTVETSTIFSDQISYNADLGKSLIINTPETNKERFYYVTDCFKVSKGAYVIKTFKGFTDTIKIVTDDMPIRYRLKSQGVTMGWQFMNESKEELLQFEYRLEDPILEILSTNGEANVNVYIDGYVTGMSAADLQSYIDTWYEEQSNVNFDMWVGNTEWWKINKIPNSKTEEWSWADRVGMVVNKTINDLGLAFGTKIVQQNSGAKLVIPSNYEENIDDSTFKFKVFKDGETNHIIELVGYNGSGAWNANRFVMETSNVRYIEFNDQTLDLTMIEYPLWDERWTDNEYYANHGIKFISESAGFKNVIGIYETDGNGKPTTSTLVIDDQNLLGENTPLMSLTPGEYDFFIMSNGAELVDMDAGDVVTFDNTGVYPEVKVNDTVVDVEVFFTDPTLNYDKKDHFIYESDGEGGTVIRVEDLPGLGDRDFNDIIMSVDFPMTDKIASFVPETIEEVFSTNGPDSMVAIKTKSSSTGLYSMGYLNVDGEKLQVWRLRNGYNYAKVIQLKDYYNYKYTYYAIPEKTDLYILTKTTTKYFRMTWFKDNNGSKTKYSKKKISGRGREAKIDINLTDETLETVTVVTSNEYYNQNNSEVMINNSGDDNILYGTACSSNTFKI